MHLKTVSDIFQEVVSVYNKICAGDVSVRAAKRVSNVVNLMQVRDVADTKSEIYQIVKTQDRSDAVPSDLQ
jgi:hypothetical protein